MVGLREIWNLGDPAALDPSIQQQVAQQQQFFSAAVNTVNGALQTIAAHAPPAVHASLVARREQLYQRYHQALAAAQQDPTSLEGVVATADELGVEAVRQASEARDLLRQWEQKTGTLEATEDIVAQAPDGGDANQLREQVLKAVEAANSRDYQAACHQLDAAAKSARSVISKETPGHTAAQTDAEVNEKRFQLAGPAADPPVVPTDRAALETWQNPLVNGDPRDLFSPERMDSVVDMHFQGEGTSELNNAMEAILFAEPGADVSQHLKAIGAARGLDEAAVQQQFERFRQLQDVAKQLEAARGLDPEEVLTEKGKTRYQNDYGDFLGSQSSLRYGQVVGEATGLDPAFASLLNPTGGMVGPGMDVLAPVDADSPVIWHGIFHDAGGYLLNYQNSGPGYTYLQHKQPESGRRGSDPLQGQVEGVSYWYERRQSDRSVVEDLYEFDFTAEDPQEKQLAYDRYVKHPIADAQQLADQITQDGLTEVRELTDATRQFSQESLTQLKDSTQTAADAVQEQVAEADATVGRYADKARELGVEGQLVDAAEQTVHEHLAAVNQQVESWENRLAATFDATSQDVENNLNEIDRWAAASAAALRQGAAEAAVELEQTIHDELVELGQDAELMETIRNTLNTALETKQDVGLLVDDVNREIDAAQARAHEFYSEAVSSIGRSVDQGAEQLADGRDALIGKLNEVRAEAAAAVALVEGKVDLVAAGLDQAGQDILDSAAGVTDSLADSVADGADAIHNSVGLATDFAAERLDRLTNLLG